MIDGLARRTVGGVLWSIFSTAAGKGLSFVSLVVLARLLAPEEFGLFAFAILFLTYLDTVGDLGTGMALIHWPGRRADAAQITFVVSLGMGAVLFLLTQLLAPTVAAFFESPSGEPILRVLGVSLLIKGLGNTHDALCRKGLRFKARVVPEVALAGLKAVVAVTLAWAGFGVWSLVWGQVIGVTAWTLVLWRIVPWRPRWRWPAETARSMFAYGRNIVAVNVLAAVIHHFDAVVVGRWLGVAALGFYQVAYRVPEMAITLLVRQIGTVLFPVFSAIHAAGRSLGAGYLRALRYVSLLTLPVVAGLVVLAEPLVLVVFGEKWAPAVPILQALAIYTGLRSLGSHAGDVLKANGRPGLLAALGLLKAALLVPVLIWVARGGAVAVAAGMAGVTGATVLLNLAVVRHVVEIGWGDVIEALRPGALAAATVAMATMVWSAAAAPLSDLWTLVGGIVVATVTYGVALRFFAVDVQRLAVAFLSGGAAKLRFARTSAGEP